VPAAIGGSFDVRCLAEAKTGGRSVFDVSNSDIIGLFRAIWVAKTLKTIDKSNHVNGR
jgi:hypothetical protein